MSARRAIGAAMVVFVAIGLFGFVAAEKGIWGAAIAFGAAAVLTAIIVIAISLLVE